MFHAFNHGFAWPMFNLKTLPESVMAVILRLQKFHGVEDFYSGKAKGIIFVANPAV
ncbi:MAG TPA: hypothetical protein VFF39_06840 [Verrucomicrobiae bacterium]|nr:hypothetical protein [Verrucomicrobiae bacterium]